MKTNGNGMFLGLALAAVLTAALSSTAFGADRVMLGEYFNGTW